MTDHDALLAAVIAAPEDDAPRLVFADWLDEHGQPERAGMIRWQCRSDLRERVWPFGPGSFISVGKDGRPGLECPPWCTDARMSRGFISAVTCTAADWLAHGDEVVAREPVGTVTLTTWPGEWRYVVGNPHWPAAWFVPWVNGSAGMAGREEFVRRALEGRWPTVRQWNLPPSETLTYGGHDVGLAAGSISVESEDIYLPIRPDIAERLLEAAEAGERDRRHAAWGARQTAGNRRQRRAAGRGR